MLGFLKKGNPRGRPPTLVICWTRSLRSGAAELAEPLTCMLCIMSRGLNKRGFERAIAPAAAMAANILLGVFSGTSGSLGRTGRTGRLGRMAGTVLAGDSNGVMVRVEELPALALLALDVGREGRRAEGGRGVLGSSGSSASAVASADFMDSSGISCFPANFAWHFLDVM